MSSPRSLEVPNLCDGAGSEGEACSDGYPNDYQYLSSGDAETDTNSSSEHHREPDFTALGDAGDHRLRDHALQPPAETAWTDGLHRLYLDLIEEAFVRTLYQGAACWGYGDFHCYTPGRGRCQPPEDIGCVCSRESDDDEEEVESNVYEPERQIGATTTLAQPVSDLQEHHGMDFNDGIMESENPPKISGVLCGIVTESWMSGHVGGLAEKNTAAMEVPCRELSYPSSKRSRNRMDMAEIGEKRYVASGDQ